MYAISFTSYRNSLISLPSKLSTLSAFLVAFSIYVQTSTYVITNYYTQLDILFYQFVGAPYHRVYNIF